MLVLGDPEGNMVLATYLYKLTNKLGTPSYHLMAAVAVVLICITVPLVMLQRRLMRTANRFVTMKEKRPRPARCRWEMALGRRDCGGGMADGHHWGAADRRGAAGLYFKLGRGRFAVG